MRTKPFLPLLLVAALAPAAEPPSPAAPPCRGSGFTVLQRYGKDLAGKPDSALNVYFDEAVFRGNGFEEALRSAMNAWNSVSGSNWRFHFSGYANNPSDYDGVMTILKGGGFAFPYGVLAVAFVQSSVSTNQITDSDIYFSPGLPINNYTSSQEYDFEMITLHEMGHTLGLGHNDHCVSSPTLMASTVGTGVAARTLFPPESDGVRYLYAPGATKGVAPAPLALLFQGVEGNPSPAPQRVKFTGPSGTDWWATPAGGSWLTVNPSSGPVPNEMTVQVATENLISGLYRGRIVVTSAGLTQVLPVELNLAAPILALRPGALSFGAVPGGPTPDAQILSVVGTVGASWTASTEPGGGWLGLAQSSGRLPATVTVSVNPAGLSPGLHTGAIRVTSSGLTREMGVSLEVAPQSRLLVDSTEVALAGQVGTALAACAPLRIASFGNVPLDFRASTDAPWLAVLPASGRTPASANLCATAGALAPGPYTATVTVTATALNSSATVPVRFSVTPAPALQTGGVTSAASFAANQPISAGQMLSLFGTNLSADTAHAASFPLPTELGSTRVLVGGVPAPLLYVSPGQINLITPGRLSSQAGAGTTITVYSGRLASPAARVNVARSSPGVFTVLGTGTGAGAITHADGAVISRLDPLRPGEAISVYLTGLGSLDPPVEDGAPAPAEPLSRAIANVRLLVDNQPAEVLYAGASPGFAGLHLVVAKVPETLPRSFPEVVVESDAVRSNRITAGGPSLLDVQPGAVRTASDATVTLRGINLPSNPAVRIGNESFPATLTEGDLQSVRVTLPARLLTRGQLSLTVVDPSAPSEAASNAVPLTVE